MRSSVARNVPIVLATMEKNWQFFLMVKEKKQLFQERKAKLI